MAIADDFTINTTLKTIKHTSGTTIYTVNAFYTYLMDYFDEVGTIRYDIPISAQTPTIYSLINGWFIDENSFKFLKTGAINTPSGGTGWSGEIYILYFDQTGYVEAVGTDIGQTVSNGGETHTGVLLDYDNTLRKWWIRKGTGVFVDSDSVTINSGTGAGTVMSSGGVLTGEMQYSCIFTLGSLVTGTILDVYQNDIQITPWWSSGHIDLLIKVKEAGTMIDSGKLTVLARKYSTLYDHYVIDASSGRNPVPLAVFNDANNQTTEGTVAGYNDITILFGHVSRDLNNGNGYQPYDCEINCAGRTLKQTYEYLKYVCRTGSSDTLNGVNGEYYLGVGDIRLNYISENNGPFEEASLITCSFGGTGYIVSLIDNGTTGTLVIRNVHGVFLDTDAITSGPTTATIGGEPESISLSKQAPFGNFAGGKFFGARGVYLTNMAGSDANNYQLIDSTNTSQIPAISIPITVSGVSDGDRVSVFRATGDNGIVDKNMYMSHASSNINGSSTFVVTTAIESDTPTSGILRVVIRDIDGNITGEKEYPYSSYSVSVFNLEGTLEDTYDDNDTAYVSYIDGVVTGSSVSVNITYSQDRYVVVRVRKKGIVPFTINSQITSSGMSVAAIRTQDSITG